MKPALFLDRDGVINVEKNYLYKVEEFDFIDGVFETCKFFSKLGYWIIIVTNQAGIARGIYTEADYQFLTNWMMSEFLKNGVKIAKVYHCPHHPSFSIECDCRKPSPGMFVQASQDFNIDMKNSIVVGDKLSDIMAAEDAGIKNRVLVESGHVISMEDKESANLVIESIKSLPQYFG